MKNFVEKILKKFGGLFT